MIETTFSGSLFTSDWLTETIVQSQDWLSIDDQALVAFQEEIAKHFDNFPTAQKPNETQTEDDLIWKILASLGWSNYLRQQNLSVKGRTNVPDGLLFPSVEAKDKANDFPEEYKRYVYGAAVVESKRWARPLDRSSGKRGEEIAPSSQLLNYLRRVDDLTDGNLRWGILTNGGRWRLYWQGARSVSEQYFEIDLAAVMGIPGHGDGLFQLDENQRLHALRIFMLMFRLEAFTSDTTDKRTFHERALEVGKVYEERVASDLSDLVFEQVFPLIVRSIADHLPDEDLQDVREAGLILLYRLLFILYAEDRDLLPVNDDRYDDYGLRKRVRLDVGERKDQKDTFSNSAARYWAILDDLCRSIDKGDASIGLPPYNGGLFDENRTVLLTKVRLPDLVMSDVIDKLSFIQEDGERKYINYRNLTVQQLGSIYERLLEYEVVREEEAVTLRPNIFARKGSGSYYTPDDLVNLIINETIEPLISRALEEFSSQSDTFAASKEDENKLLFKLKKHDPALAILDLKICDPAMGSGHFLVSLVDYLTDQVINAMAEASEIVEWAEDYISPLSQKIEDIRATIITNAEDGDWIVDDEQLDDKHIIRRMVLKRCVYGVDKNVMAVELAKVALWLHSFTVGAPLSFLDHHLRCGDSLFGSWVNKGIQAVNTYGSPLLMYEPIKEAIGTAAIMQDIENLPDAEIKDAKSSARYFDGLTAATAPLNTLLNYIHALSWLDLKGKENKAAMHAFFDGEYGEPIAIARGRIKPRPGSPGEPSREKFERFEAIQKQVLELIDEENFFNWQVAFPGVWNDWEADSLQGGFDAVIGNPPWDRMKLQQVEWFEARKPEIAKASTAAKRKAMIKTLQDNDDPLATDFDKASKRAADGTRIARKCGDYPLLSGGDINLYSLFVERAMHLVKRDGIVGLLTPSGIASDKTASTFFKGVATEGRLKALYDFENRRTRHDLEPFFPSVDSRFKFVVFVASPSPTSKPANCAFFLQSIGELNNKEICFPLTAEDFASVNPNTGTAPIFRSRRDAKLTTDIYARVPILVDRTSDEIIKTWPVKYVRMFDMTNDSDKFRTREELENEEGAYPIGGNRFQNAQGDWLPLYEGKMVQAYDHRAASIKINPDNQHRPAQSEPTLPEQHSDPNWLPDPQFWTLANAPLGVHKHNWTLGFKEITAPTNMRTFIAAAFPPVAFGNKVPVFLEDGTDDFFQIRWLLLANFNALPFDFVTRQKVQGQTLNLFIVEQLPIIPPEKYEITSFGTKTATECIREAILELIYTAHDMAPFARDMGYVDDAGDVKPPYSWDEERRLRLRAKLDAIFFNLYGITDRDDVRYIYSTFPIVERQEAEKYDRYLSRDLCLAYMNALAAGNPDAEIVL
ncbi:MAG: hypothetical protein ABJO72_00945 [Hyphomicrobiales bacterium]